MYTKKLLIVILYLILGYGCVWTFNHISPWVSIFSALIIGLIAFYQLEKNYKK